jgi:hypothetical protein
MSVDDPSDKATMMPADMSVPETEIEIRIRTLQPMRRRLMFSELAEAFPDCTWQILFTALSRLSQRKHVELVPHRWDYEVIFLSTDPSEQVTSRSSKASEQYGYNERAPV